MYINDTGCDDDPSARGLAFRPRGDVMKRSHDQSGVPGVISDGHFPAQPNHFIPGFLSYSVAVFLK
jgi:hypothetical protein